FIGTGIEWVMTQNFFVAVQDFRMGIPGMLIQLFGGYFVLKALAKA
ncbi:MAG: ECF transporter S component, partial [Bacteroidales bacterium]|nr:ECF transporter S component [Bacteroidales bacterium]